MRMPIATAGVPRVSSHWRTSTSHADSPQVIPSREPSPPGDDHQVCDPTTKITCGFGCCDRKKEYCSIRSGDPECHPLEQFKKGENFCVHLDGDQFCVNTL